MLCQIAIAEIEDETGGCHSHTKGGSQVDAGCVVEPRGSGEKPDGYDAAYVNYDRAERDCRCAAVMRLYVVRLPRDDARSEGISAYGLKK